MRLLAGLLAAMSVVLTLCYPLAVWYGQGRVEPRWLAVLLVLAALARLPAMKVSLAARWSAAGALALAAVTVMGNAMLPLKLYPVLVNAALLGAFAYTLTTPVSMVERFARMREPDLPPAAVAYTRTVTKVWCVFFVVNGAIALGTALWATQEVWSLYNGVIAYGLMGVLFAAEFLVRLRFKRLHHG
ncbi:COG4648 family protein [Massilia pseudoviolaceinigra]|uniref:COG4648 family protein n=1 Tax=Massilia pseudoviolaceinigra TaxID=3057165 RepID=UPI002796BBAC|nr:hypothetical protein [Massilia sp. CCM 9206]MDQ1920577.1 hypothetical protein [Massilia sp. CCM 9206]